MPVHSKLQLKVLSLYRQFLRTARNKPGAMQHVQEEFHRNSEIPRLEIVRIEHIIRRAERQLKLLSNSSIKSIGLFRADPVSSSPSEEGRTSELLSSSQHAGYSKLQDNNKSAEAAQSKTESQDSQIIINANNKAVR